ncbi:zinc finger protein 266 [Cricetulus griseus]
MQGSVPPSRGPPARGRGRDPGCALPVLCKGARLLVLPYPEARSPSLGRVRCPSLVWSGGRVGFVYVWFRDGIQGLVHATQGLYQLNHNLAPRKTQGPKISNSEEDLAATVLGVASDPRAPGGKAKDKDWIPVTKLGSLVKEVKIKSLTLCLFSLPSKESKIKSLSRVSAALSSPPKEGSSRPDREQTSFSLRPEGLQRGRERRAGSGSDVTPDPPPFLGALGPSRRLSEGSPLGSVRIRLCRLTFVDLSPAPKEQTFRHRHHTEALHLPLPHRATLSAACSPAVAERWIHKLSRSDLGIREGSVQAHFTISITGWQPLICPMDSVTFDDVTVEFTPDEWTLLDLTQRNLYREVMLENYENLTSVELELQPRIDDSELQNYFKMQSSDELEMVGDSSLPQQSGNHSEEDICDSKPGGEVLGEQLCLNTEVSMSSQGYSSECNWYGKDILSLLKETSTGQNVSELNQCGKIFSLTPNIMYPSTSTNEKPFEFTDCETVFFNQSYFQTDMRPHNGGEPYDWNKYGNGFIHPTSFAMHLPILNARNPYKFEECGKDFQYFACLNNPMGMCTGEKFCDCKECWKAFTVSSHLTQYVSIHTEEKSKVCKICGKSFANFSRLSAHVKTHTEEKPFVCKECGKAFKNVSYLNDHVRIHTGIKSYKCMECGKAFLRWSGLTEHIRVHTGEKPYECKECGKTFSRSTQLTEHIRTHTGIKPYECKECGKAFTQYSGLATHVRIHSGEKPFECKECGKAFTRTSGLIHHVRTHTGEKPFECVHCGKTFITSSHRTKHLKIHSGEKPFVCNVCGKAFIYSTSLNIHMRTHTGEKPYICKQCGKAFAVYSRLRKHSRVHTEEKPYQCEGMSVAI